MLNVFEDMINTPEEFVMRADVEASKIREDATWLLDQLPLFEDGGRYANLGTASTLDLRDEK